MESKVTWPAAVSPLSFINSDVVSLLKRLLKQAEKGEIHSVAVAWEMPAGWAGHEAAFGKFSNRTLLVGKLHVLAQHIVLEECLEWKPA